MQWRSFIVSLSATRPVPWYGNAPWWRVALECRAPRAYGESLTVTEWPRHNPHYSLSLPMR